MNRYNMAKEIRNALVEADDFVVEPRMKITTSELWGAALRAGVWIGMLIAAASVFAVAAVNNITHGQVWIGILTLALAVCIAMAVSTNRAAEYFTAYALVLLREEERKKRG